MAFVQPRQHRNPYIEYQAGHRTLLFDALLGGTLPLSPGRQLAHLALAGCRIR
jgi:hypothetical protein